MSWMTLPDGRTLGKGDKIHANGFLAAPLGTYSIAGAQPKIVGTRVDVTGEVRHVRGNHPTDPTRIWIFFKLPEGAKAEGIREVVDCAKCGEIKEHVIEYLPGMEITLIEQTGEHRSPTPPEG